MKWSKMQDLGGGSIYHTDLGRYYYRSSTTLTDDEGFRLAEVERFSSSAGSIYQVWCVAGGIEPISRVLWDGESLKEAKRIAEAMVEEVNPPLSLGEVKELIARHLHQAMGLLAASVDPKRSESERDSFRRQAESLHGLFVGYRELKIKLENEEVQS